ncbi:hypothetical protein ACFLXH_04235 [Chloroflexota bacterium]
MEAKSLVDVVFLYQQFASAENLSPRTIETTCHAVKLFDRILGGCKEITQLDAADLRRYIWHLQAKSRWDGHPSIATTHGKLSPFTVACYIRSIKSFWAWLYREEFIPQNPFERVKVPAVPFQIVKPFTPGQVENVLDQIPRKSHKGYRGAFFHEVGHDFGWWWLVAGYLIPVLAFAALLFKPKQKVVLFAALLAIIGILVTSAQVGPLGSIWYWLYAHVSFLGIFRDPSYFIELATVGYALLLGFMATLLIERLKTIGVKIFPKGKNRSLSLTRLLVVIPLLAIVLLYGAPYLTGNFGGYMQTCPVYTDDHRALWQWLHDNPEDFRILQTQGPYPNYYSGVDRWGFDQMAVYPGKPNLYYSKVYDPQITSFLFKTIQNQRTDRLGQLAGLMNINYLIFDPDKYPGVTPASWASLEEHFSNDNILTTLNGQNDIFLFDQKGDIQIYKNADCLPHIFPVSQLGLYAGDLDGLVSMSYMDDMKIKDLALVFVSQLSPEDLEILAQTPGSKVVIQQGSFPDLLLAASTQKQVFNPFNLTAGNNNPEMGWAFMWYPWYNWRYQANLERRAFTFTSSNLTIPLSVEEGGEYHLFLKPYFGVEGSFLRVSSDGTAVGEVTTEVPGDVGFQWVDLGPFSLEPGSHSFQIEGDDGRNGLGGLVLVSQTALEQAQQRVNELLQGKDIILVSELNSANPREVVWSRGAQEIYQAAVDTPQRYPRGDPYDISVQDDTFVLTLTFSHEAGIQEAFILDKDTSDSPIDLVTAPYFTLNYKIDNPDVQYPIFRFFIDTDGDGKSDAIFRSYDDGGIMATINSKDPTVFQASKFNVLEAVKRQIPGASVYHVVGIELDMRKFGDIDCSGGLHGDYSIYIKEIQFISYPTTLTDNWVQASQGTTLSTTFINAVPIHQALSVPKEGTYKISLRAASQDIPSWVVVKIGDSQFPVTLSPGFEWHDLGEITLDEGYYNVTFVPDGSDIVHIDMLVLADPLLSPASGIGVDLTTEQISYTEYSIHTQASEPFWIFFSERYDGDWNLFLDDGSEVQNYPGYSFGNLFYVDKTGEFDIILEFGRQTGYSALIKFSFICFGVAFLGVVIPARVYRHLRKQNRTVMQMLSRKLH